MVLFLHSLLEELDFSIFKTTTSKRTFKKTKKIISRMDFHLDYFRILKREEGRFILEKETVQKRTVEILWNLLNANILDQKGALFRLVDLPKENRVSEMDFYLDLDTNPGNFLRGSIDLVFQIDDKFYLADYKSNLLEDYSTISLKRNVENLESRYDLQRDIYALVLYEYLKNLFGPKEALQKIGGVYYFFLRGMIYGESSGIYSDFFWSLERIESIRKTVLESTTFRWEKSN
ncbi:PD-(D/E)XK nuclease family protein [Leptospira interrogans serovar Canicola]|nr:PD-(D/E)XK nuclease family protein [Leptospira interrogans serovar Canicola]